MAIPVIADWLCGHLPMRVVPAATYGSRAVIVTAFFALPTATKQQYHIAGSGGVRGYTPFGIETAKGAQHHDLKEFWHVGRELPEGHPYRRYMRDNVWPTEIEGFREHLYGMFEDLDALGARILRAIARYLKLGDDFFADKVEMGNSVLRMLHYPPVPADAPGVRAGAHEDINVITLLLGAEVDRPRPVSEENEERVLRMMLEANERG